MQEAIEHERMVGENTRRKSSEMILLEYFVCRSQIMLRQVLLFCLLIAAVEATVGIFRTFVFVSIIFTC